MGCAAVCRMGGIGDNLVASSVLPALKQKFGRVEVITTKPFGIVFENNPDVDRLIYKDDKDLPQSGADDWAMWFRLRSKEYDGFYHLSHSIEFRNACFPAQTDFDRPAAWRRKYCGNSYLEFTHDCCDVPYHPIGARYYPTDAEIARAKQDKSQKLRNGRDGPVIGYICSGTRIDKRHPRAGFVVARLINELSATVVLFGSYNQRDHIIATEVETQVRQHNGTLDGLRICMSPTKEIDDAGGDNSWAIRRGLAQVRECDLLITPDTGPAWAASMCPFPKVLMVSHASANNISKHWVDTTTLQAEQKRVPCFPCHQLHTDASTCTPNFENDGPACVSDISVEAIVQAAKTWLERPDFAREKLCGAFTNEGLRDAIRGEPKIVALPKAPEIRWGRDAAE